LGLGTPLLREHTWKISARCHEKHYRKVGLSTIFVKCKIIRKDGFHRVLLKPFRSCFRVLCSCKVVNFSWKHTYWYHMIIINTKGGFTKKVSASHLDILIVLHIFKLTKCFHGNLTYISFCKCQGLVRHCFGNINEKFQHDGIKNSGENKV